MKCPNCGGNLSVNDVKCPYCGTPNPRETKELLMPYIPAYPDIYPQNQEQLSVWQEEAKMYLVGILNFTEEEIYAEED